MNAGEKLSGYRSDSREFRQQFIETFLAKCALDPSLCLLPQWPGTPKGLFSFPREKDQAHASIFAFLKAHQVLLHEQPQVAGEGCPIHFHELGQTIDRKALLQKHEDGHQG